MARKRLTFFLRTKSFLKRRSRPIFLWALSLIFTIIPHGVMGLTATQNPIQPPAIAQERSSTHVQVEEGRKFYRLGRIPEAVAVWQQGLQDYRVKGDVLSQAMILNYLCLAYQKLGQWENARQAIQESLTLLPSDPSREASTEQLPILAQALNAKGRLQLTLLQPQNALVTWQQATAIYARVGDRQGEIGSRINQAQAQEALGFYRRALKTLLQVEKTLSAQDYELQATGFLSLGIAYRVIGDLDKSWEALEKSRNIAKNYYPQVLAETQLSLGNTARALANRDLESDSTAAEKKQTEALQLYQQAAQYSSLPTRLRANLNRLRLLIDMTDWQQARAIAQTLQSDINKLPAMLLSVQARINFASSLIQFREAGQTDALELREIVELLNTAIEQARTLKSQESEAYAWGELGHLYEVRKEWQDAEAYTQKAIALARAIDAPEVTYRWEWQLGRLREMQGDRSGAIAAYENAVNTLQRIPPNLVALTKNLSNVNSEDDITSNIQFYFRDNVEPVYRQLVDLLLREPDPAQIDEARTVIQQLQVAELEQLLQCNLQNVTSEKLDRVVDREGSRDAVIYPIILGDRLEIILKLPHQPLQDYTVNVARKDVEATLKSLGKKVRRSGPTKELKSESQKLYNWLIEPEKSKLAESEINTLVFILDSTWQNIPMSVLYDGDRYLIEDYAVVIAPPGLKLKEPKALEREDLRVILGGVSKGYHDLPGLPQVPAQFKEISSIISSTVLLNDAFNKATLQDKINFSTFPVVHLATHGQFSSRPQETYIITSDDDRIDINELKNLLQGRQQTTPKPIELLVLSACETADGDKKASLGLTGIALQSGVRSTLATLWKIPADPLPVVLFSRFYQELQENPEISKAEALRRAQVAIIEGTRQGLYNQDKWVRPYYWAPYVLIGNWL